MANKYMKRCSTSFDTRKFLTKNVIYLPIRMVKIQKLRTEFQESRKNWWHQASDAAVPTSLPKRNPTLTDLGVLQEQQENPEMKNTWTLSYLYQDPWEHIEFFLCSFVFSRVSYMIGVLCISPHGSVVHFLCR